MRELLLRSARPSRLPLAVAAALFVAGCAVGPDYRQPTVPLDAGFVTPARPTPRTPTSRPSGAASATPS